MLGTLKARERRFHHGFACPRCRATRVQRWGRERTGIQRDRCLDCARTFNDLTHTAMAGTRLREKWPAYADTMRDALSTRQAAALLNIDHKTTWRWRHKVMAHLAPETPPPLSGIVEADETYFRRNFKGSHPVGRRRRKRGTLNGSKRGLGKDKVPVLVARARSGDTQAIVLPGTSSALALTAALRDVLAPGVTLCTDGSKALRSTAQALGLKHVALVTARRQRKRGIYHVQTVNSYQGRLKGWMRRFRGVATKYLARYLGWHVLHERVQRVSAMNARSVLLGNTAELAAHRCCPDCGAVLSAA
jgi:transposase-like protein